MLSYYTLSVFTAVFFEVVDSVSQIIHDEELGGNLLVLDLDLRLEVLAPLLCGLALALHGAQTLLLLGQLRLARCPLRFDLRFAVFAISNCYTKYCLVSGGPSCSSGLFSYLRWPFGRKSRFARE